MHLNNCGPLQQAATVHNQKLTRANLVDNTKILYHESNIKKLTILEALAIKNLNPSINTLELFHKIFNTNCIIIHPHPQPTTFFIQTVHIHDTLLPVVNFPDKIICLFLCTLYLLPKMVAA